MGQSHKVFSRKVNVKQTFQKWGTVKFGKNVEVIIEDGEPFAYVVNGKLDGYRNPLTGEWVGEKLPALLM